MKKRFSFLCKIPRNAWISFALLFFAAVLAALFPSLHRLLAVFGMACCTLGDLALMNFGGFFSKHARFPLGCGAFMLAHLLYAAAYLVRAEHGFAVSAVIICFAVSMLTVSVLMTSFIGKHRPDRMIRLLGIVYAAVIALDGAAVLSASDVKCPGVLGIVGIMLFFVSDVCIAVRAMTGSDTAGRWVWRLYPIGQILILISA